MWVNGYRDIDSWLEMIGRIKGPLTMNQRREIIGLFDYFKKPEMQTSYFSFCMQCRRLEYLNGKAKANN
jgi:hypothetical protein